MIKFFGELKEGDFFKWTNKDNIYLKVEEKEGHNTIIIKSGDFGHFPNFIRIETLTSEEVLKEISKILIDKTGKVC